MFHFKVSRDANGLVVKPLDKNQEYSFYQLNMHDDKIYPLTEHEILFVNLKKLIHDDVDPNFRTIFTATGETKFFGKLKFDGNHKIYKIDKYMCDVVFDNLEGTFLN